MKNRIKILIKSVSALTILAILITFLPPVFQSRGATLTTIYDRLSTVEQSQTAGVDHYVVFTTTGAVSGGTNSVLVLQFPDADDGLWCRTAGTDLTVAGITEDSATALPGTLSAKCTQGSGADSYDKIYVCASGSNTWSAGTKYGVSIKDGTIGKLGTPTAANNIKVTATTGTAASCTDPTPVDTADFALSILSDATVAVSATVDPLISFSISDTTIGFGTLSSSSVRWATSDETGSTSEPGAGNPTQVSVSTNAPNGAIISARSKGNGNGAEGNGSAGLYKSSSPTKLIAAVASSSVSAGLEGYGLYVKNVGSNLTAASGFDNNGSGDLAISTTSQTILSASAPLSSNNTADIALKASVAGSTTSGIYSDVIYLTATGKF